ncbi:RNA polymerase sporulation sigma factor SigG [Domibacillus enclensis]|uniref:RNA polymerase sigma factor n=1 Tax=Domibacillus enclensis TaxID=1017273 RepID=A0A1N6UAP0_9BACI|nr:RNA polymerase sporulation sigma factor SigG [Domibacillus enclensis]OXS78477.1 sporulation sigma factor SigG [Domibacillus enclensis]SIQ62649.1 RNA polymerase, sigma subunit, RpsG/SigG [Domibacillus enclensis]
MARNKVVLCGVDTSTLPVLTNPEMKVLFVQYQSGDKQARETLVTGNLRLVLSVIQRFNHRNEQADDLFQVGCIGLMKSIDNFDLSHNVRFSTYAVPMIIGEIRRYLRDNNPIRVSRSLRDIAYKALQAREKLTAERSVEPAAEDIARAIDVPKEEMVFALDAIQDPVSLFEPVFQDGGDPIYMMDQISDGHDREKEWVDTMTLTDELFKLSDRERMIIEKRFFTGRTQMEVAEEIGISQAQVSRLEKGAIKQMKKKING